MTLGASIALVIALGFTFYNGHPALQSGGETGSSSKPSLSFPKTEIHSLSGTEIAEAQPRIRRSSSASLQSSGTQLMRQTSDTVRSKIDSRISESLQSAGNKTPKRLPGAGRVSGQLTDESGNPLADVIIKFTAFTQAQPVRNMTSGTSSISMSQPVQQSGMKETDSRGRFSIDSPTTGVGTIYVDHPPYVRLLQEVTFPTENIKLILSRENGGMAKGVIKNQATGERVPFARISVQYGLQIDVPGFGVDGNTKLTAVTAMDRMESDENGLYSLDRLPACHLSLTAWADDIGPSIPSNAQLGDSKVKNAFPVKAGEAAVLPDMMLYPGYTMRGYVRDYNTRQPLAGVQIGPAMEIFSLADPAIKRTTSDSNGYYELKYISPHIMGGKNQDPETLLFDPFSAKKDGYKKETKMLRFKDRTFDVNNLIIEQDFELRPGSSESLPGVISIPR